MAAYVVLFLLKEISKLVVSGPIRRKISPVRFLPFIPFLFSHLPLSPRFPVIRAFSTSPLLCLGNIDPDLPTPVLCDWSPFSGSTSLHVPLTENLPLSGPCPRHALLK